MTQGRGLGDVARGGVCLQQGGLLLNFGKLLALGFFLTVEVALI